MIVLTDQKTLKSPVSLHSKVQSKKEALSIWELSFSAINGRRRGTVIEIFDSFNGQKYASVKFEGGGGGAFSCPIDDLEEVTEDGEVGQVDSSTEGDDRALRERSE